MSAIKRRKRREIDVVDDLITESEPSCSDKKTKEAMTKSGLNVPKTKDDKEQEWWRYVSHLLNRKVQAEDAAKEAAIERKEVTGRLLALFADRASVEVLQSQDRPLLADVQDDNEQDDTDGEQEGNPCAADDDLDDSDDTDLDKYDLESPDYIITSILDKLSNKTKKLIDVTTKCNKKKQAEKDLVRWIASTSCQFEMGETLTDDERAQYNQVYEAFDNAWTSSGQCSVQPIYYNRLCWSIVTLRSACKCCDDPGIHRAHTTATLIRDLVNCCLADYVINRSGLPQSTMVLYKFFVSDIMAIYKRACQVKIEYSIDIGGPDPDDLDCIEVLNTLWIIGNLKTPDNIASIILAARDNCLCITNPDRYDLVEYADNLAYGGQQDQEVSDNA